MKSLKLIVPLIIAVASFNTSANPYRLSKANNIKNKPASIANLHSIKPSSVYHFRSLRVPQSLVSHSHTQSVHSRSHAQSYHSRSQTERSMSVLSSASSRSYSEQSVRNQKPENISGQVFDVERAPKKCTIDKTARSKNKQFKCEDGGYLITVIYIGENDKINYHTVYSEVIKNKGDSFEI